MEVTYIHTQRKEEGMIANKSIFPCKRSIKINHTHTRELIDRFLPPTMQNIFMAKKRKGV
jgi:hypothetical protein